MKVNFSDCFRHWTSCIIQKKNARSVLRGEILMSNKDKLIQYINNLTNEEAEIIISFLKESASSEEVSPHLPLYIVPQEQATSV